MVLTVSSSKKRPSHWKVPEKKEPVVKPKEKEADFMSLIEAHQATWGTSKTDAMKAVMVKFPEAHRAYLKKHNPDNPNL